MCFRRNTAVPLFLFYGENSYERKKNMRRFQKLGSSVSMLIVAILAVFCFTRGTLQAVLYGVLFLAWGIYAFITFMVPIIKRYKYRRQVRQIMEEQQKATVRNTENTKTDYLLLRHVNHRITGYIKSIYPDATWSWKSANPADIMANGGTGRIEVFGIKEYNFADISFDEEANIECSLLKIVSLKQAAQTEGQEATTETPKSEIDPQVWFEKSGRIVLKNLIADLSSRGHNTLTIKDDGSCVIKQGEQNITVSQLEAFPERVYHPRLIKVMAGAGIAAKAVDAGLSVNW